MAKILAVDDEAKILQIIKESTGKRWAYRTDCPGWGRGKTDGVVPI